MMGGWTVKYSISCVLSHMTFMWEMELKQQLELKLLEGCSVPQSDKNVTMKRKLSTTPKLALYLSSSVSLALRFVVLKKDLSYYGMGLCRYTVYLLK